MVCSLTFGYLQLLQILLYFNSYTKIKSHFIGHHSSIPIFCICEYIYLYQYILYKSLYFHKLLRYCIVFLFQLFQFYANSCYKTNIVVINSLSYCLSGKVGKFFSRSPWTVLLNIILLAGSVFFQHFEYIISLFPPCLQSFSGKIC